MNYKTRDLVYGALMVALICIGAWIKVPLPWTPIPVTMQTAVIVFTALYLPRKNAMLAIIVYILLGVAGIPVFSGSTGGFGVLFGATGGFIMGFPLMVYIISILFNKKNKKPVIYIYTIIPVVLGYIALYVCGAAWFALTMDKSIAVAFSTCVFPFLPGDALKAVSAVVLYATMSRMKVRTA